LTQQDITEGVKVAMTDLGFFVVPTEGSALNQRPQTKFDVFETQIDQLKKDAEDDKVSKIPNVSFFGFR
jgi:hypothetical protein